VIVYNVFKTPTNYYVFDRNRNKIFNVPEEDYNELALFNQKKINKEEVTCLSKYQKYGFLKESVLEEVVHPETNYIKYHLDHKVRMLVLQITQNCNLRCDYCAYSGLYDNRTHCDKNMPLETAKKALDYLFSHSDEIDEMVYIGFYGGEPLLRFDFIKECINYIDENYPDRAVKYSMTTNGTLLTVDVAKYLTERDFSLTISLDGSRETHNANRKFPNGEGSFDIIMNNIKKINEIDPLFIHKLRFNTVLNPKVDYGTISNYFSTEDIVCQANVVLSYIERINCKEDIVFADEFVNESRYSFLKTILIMLKRLKGVEIPNHAYSMKSFLHKDYEILSKNSVGLTKKCHHSGPCIPGSARLYVTVEGKLFSCEKASDTSYSMNIGDLDHGVDLDKAVELMNIGKLNEEKCKRCWAFSWCTLCGMFAQKNGRLEAGAICSNCVEARAAAVENFINICVLRELGYEFDKEEMYE